MARKIILKEDGLNGAGAAPTGYKYLGDDAGTVSQKVGATVSGLGGSEWTETIVNISASQLLNLGTSPVELLPAPGVGKYYEIDKIVVEFTHGTTPYDRNGVTLLSFQESGGAIYPTPNSGGGINGFSVYYLTDNSEGNQISAVLRVSSDFIPVNKNMRIRSEDDNGNNFNMLDGDGTMRIIIYSKIRTFGA